MRDITKLLIVALVLIILPLAARQVNFNTGMYDPGDLPEIDDSDLIDTLPDYNTYLDVPAEGGGTVIFDLSHRSNTFINDLLPLRDRISNRGAAIVDFDADSGFSTSILRGATALVIVSPTRSYSERERAAIVDFAEDGGRVLLIADPTRTAELIVNDFITALFPESAIPAINSIANEFGIVYVDDYLYNLSRNEGNYRNVILRRFNADHALTEGIDTLIMFATHSLRSDGLALITADRNTFSPVRTGETGLSPAVLSADGQVLALGDVTFLTPPFHTMADNDHFLSNIADWLGTAQRDWDLTDFPYLFSRPVDLISAVEGRIDPKLILKINELDEVLQAAGKSISLSSKAIAGHDSIYVATYDEADQVKDFLSIVGIAITEEDEAFEIEIDALGTFGSQGTTLFLTLESDNAIIIVLVAEDDDAVLDGLDMLINVDFDQCITSGIITFCSTGQRADEEAVDEEEEEEQQPELASGPCDDLATTEAISADFPRLGSPAESQCMLENGLAPSLVLFSEEIGQDTPYEPGDVYIYPIFSDESFDAIWRWGWCATPDTFDGNWENITLTFTLNDIDIPLSDFVVEDDGDEDISCRSYYILLTDWPDGNHEVITEIIFEVDLDDGFDVYDAGSRILIYNISIGG